MKIWNYAWYTKNCPFYKKKYRIQLPVYRISKATMMCHMGSQWCTITTLPCITILMESIQYWVSIERQIQCLINAESTDAHTGCLYTESMIVKMWRLKVHLLWHMAIVHRVWHKILAVKWNVHFLYFLFSLKISTNPC